MLVIDPKPGGLIKEIIDRAAQPMLYNYNLLDSSLQKWVLFLIASSSLSDSHLGLLKVLPRFADQQLYPRKQREILMGFVPVRIYDALTYVPSLAPI